MIGVRLVLAIVGIFSSSEEILGGEIIGLLGRHEVA